MGRTLQPNTLNHPKHTPLIPSVKPKKGSIYTFSKLIITNKYLNAKSHAAMTPLTSAVSRFIVKRPTPAYFSTKQNVTQKQIFN
jgi:hypothetical protein